MNIHFTPSFLIKNRFGTYYFRYLVPKIFSGYTDKRFEIRRSLKTNLRSVALERARRLLVSIEALIIEFGMKQSQEADPVAWLRQTISTILLKEDLDSKQRSDLATLLAEAATKLEGPLEVMDVSGGTTKRSKRKQPRLTGLAAYRISEVIEKYCLEVQRHWRPKTEFENRFLLDLIHQILGDRMIGSLTLEDMRTYKEAVLKLPKHRSKLPKYRGMSVQDLLKLEIPIEERLGARNAQKYLSRGRTFFNWARINGFMATEIGSVLTYKLPERDKKERLPFSQTELRKLIQSPEYLNGTHLRSHHFWLPLLGMFTGARLNELCQLHCNDVYRVKQIWVISIRDGEGRMIKNRSSKREIPIHSKLIELGFVRFAMNQLNLGHKLIFSDLKPHRDGYGGSVSKWFCEYQERCGVKPYDPSKQLKGFHSYRHTVATTLACSRAPNLHERVINQILGHEKGKSTSMREYAHTIDIATMKEAVEQIVYKKVGISHLLKSKINPYVKMADAYWKKNDE